MRKRILSLTLGLALLLAAGCYANRELPATPDPQPSDQQQLVNDAESLVREMRANSDTGRINSLLPDAKGVLIFPGVIKAGFVVGGQGGNGVMLVRKKDGAWSQPAFYTLGSGSIGLQIGAQRASIMLLFMNQAAVDKAIASGMTLGADASLAAGNYGAQGLASTTNLQPDVYYFSLLDGMFAGVAVDGGAVGTRDDWDERYYGPGATSETVLLQNRYSNKGSAALRQALSR